MVFANKKEEKTKLWITKDVDGIYIWEEMPYLEDGSFTSSDNYEYSSLDNFYSDFGLRFIFEKACEGLKQGEMREVELSIKY